MMWISAQIWLGGDFSNMKDTGVDTLITPANYAFGIWGPIYTLMALYAVYQSLPDDWVPSRNNELFFSTNGIGYLFILNQFFSIVCAFFAFNGEPWALAVSIASIFPMMVTAPMMMMVSDDMNTNWFEWIIL